MPTAPPIALTLASVSYENVGPLVRCNVGTLEKSADFFDFDRFQYGIENESRELIFLENLQSS